MWRPVTQGCPGLGAAVGSCVGVLDGEELVGDSVGAKVVYAVGDSVGDEGVHGVSLQIIFKSKLQPVPLVNLASS